MSDSKVVYSCEDFEAKLEEHSGQVFLHCEVFHFNKSVMKRMQVVFEEICEGMRYFGFSYLNAYTPNPKFVKKFGEPVVVKTIPYGEEEYEVMVWEL